MVITGLGLPLLKGDCVSSDSLFVFYIDESAGWAIYYCQMNELIQENDFTDEKTLSWQIKVESRVEIKL